MGSHQMVSQSASQSSSSFQQQQRSASSSNRQASSSNNNNGAIEACSDTTASQQQNGYGSVLQKSKSGGSLVQENTDSLLKEMDNALKASSNFIETHRSSSSSGPNSRSTQEYHEYRSYSNGGTNRGGGSCGEFNLERQVQHMMPPPSPSLSGLMERSNQQRNISNMTSQQQQQQSTYTTYKVQSNQYSSSSNNQMISSHAEDMNGQDDRPGSRLKQNIDELDTLLSDLNNARKDNTPSGGPDYNLSSDDYSFSENQQGHVNKQVRTLNEYTYNQTSSSTSAKPPSPSPRRRSDVRPGGPILASPSTVRKASPSPVSTSTPRRHGRESSPPGAVHYSSSYHSEQQQKTTTSSLQDYARSGSPYNPDRGSPAPGPPPRSQLSPNDGTPTGVSYYTKYHSTHSHHSQQNDTNGAPVTFPTRDGSPIKSTQNPPKRVDDLMTELSEFDPSIQPTGFIEPTGPPKSHITETSYTTKTTTESDFGSGRNYRDRSASPPVRPQPSTPGPAVYYPPGEIFTSSKGKYDSLDNNATDSKPAPTPVVHASHSTSLAEGRGKGQAKAEYGYKAKGRYQESASESGKQGAAVVPICLPLCCAAPCVIFVNGFINEMVISSYKIRHHQTHITYYYINS